MMVRKVRTLEEHNRQLRNILEEEREAKNTESDQMRKEYEEKLRTKLRRMKTSEREKENQTVIKEGGQT